MKNIFNTFAILLLLTSFISCRKNTTEFDGPSINDIFSNFKLLENFKADRDSVNFTAGQKVIFTARFNKVVNWTITIKGATSKSVKEIKGTAKTIDASNATWDGSTSQFPMFTTEYCTATLTIEDVTDTFTVSEKIIGTKKIDGFIVADFESGLKPGWVRFAQSGANMDFQIKTDSLAPEGKKYMNMAGTVNWDWLIGLLDFPATAYGAAKTFPLNTNPETVYFNCLVYGVPSVNPSLVLFQFREDENGDGIVNANTDDEYDYQINVDWVGWKLISVKYKDMGYLVNGAPATPKGNGLHNPDKISKISMLHLANPNDGFASSKLDLIVFTENAPLQP
jgi:hypothetical protein